MLRRVELNGRDASNGGEPWSIRQTAVYHNLSEHTSPKEKPRKANLKSTFLLIAPSENVEWHRSQYLENTTGAGKTISQVVPWNLHQILIADSMRGWMDYMASLEERLKDRVSQ
jgi:hypothetical protein